MNKVTFNWRDAFMALVNRTSSKRLTITEEELARAHETNNGMIIDNGKWSVLAGEFGITETINRDMANGHDDIVPLLTEIANQNMEGAP